TQEDGATPAAPEKTRVADGAPHLAAGQAAGVPSAEAGELLEKNKGGEPKQKQNLLLFPSVIPRTSPYLRYLHLTFNHIVTPGTPSTWAMSPRPHVAREFLAFMLTMANEEVEGEAPVEPTLAPEEDPAIVRALYKCTSGLRTNDDLWHQRLGHPSRVTLKICIEAGVFATGALLCPDGTEKITNARDVIFYERLNLAQFRKDEQTNANRVYTNDRHSYATPKDESAAAILEQDTRGEFTGGDHHSSDDNDEYPPEGGVGAAGGSSRGAATPPPPKPESDDDDVQEVIPQHCHDSTV
ncbi:unnamed protein product, partial [Closterium sp. NIES-53]